MLYSYHLPSPAFAVSALKLVGTYPSAGSSVTESNAAGPRSIAPAPSAVMTWLRRKPRSPHHRPRRFVVLVEVARGVAERGIRLRQRGTVLREHAAGERVGGCAVNERQRFLPRFVGIDV